MIKLQCKSWFDPKDLVYIIERYNPFAFKDKEGRLLLFKDYTAAYRYTLKQLAKRFPKGYIDMTIFLCEQMSISLKETVQEVTQWKELGIKDDIFYLKIWERTTERNSMLTDIFKVLHMISGTKFDEFSFRIAMKEFDTWWDDTE
jgi:hypothetical protein